MEVNSDFGARCIVHTSGMGWVKSPMPGVERRMLDRLGEEVARATSIVRYAPKSRFSPHVHTGGEEFLVLDGVFEDEHGVFPAGSYIRNPPQSRHTPGSDPGCTIFVKLWQFDPDDRTHIRIDTNKMKFVTDPGRPGVEVMPLFCDAREDVALERWKGGSKISIDAPDGLEILVLEGSFEEQGELLQSGSWMRLPKNSNCMATVKEPGTRIWIKRNHLANDPVPPGA